VYGRSELPPGGPVPVSDRRLIRWDPAAGTAAVRHEWRDAEPATASLAGVARETAAVTRTLQRSGAGELIVVPLDAPGPAVSFDMPAGSLAAFTALEPNRLYNVQDLRFYRTRPTLGRTALPRLLQPGGSLAGDYHTVRLP
jgi:hypothetical protein